MQPHTSAASSIFSSLSSPAVAMRHTPHLAAVLGAAAAAALLIPRTPVPPGMLNTPQRPSTAGRVEEGPPAAKAESGGGAATVSPLRSSSKAENSAPRETRWRWRWQSRRLLRAALPDVKSAQLPAAHLDPPRSRDGAIVISVESIAMSSDCCACQAEVATREPRCEVVCASWCMSIGAPFGKTGVARIKGPPKSVSPRILIAVAFQSLLLPGP